MHAFNDILYKRSTPYWLLAIVAFVLMIPHSMAPWGNGNYPTDASVYIRCAQWMNEGLVMYRDMFDHKGPLVYIVYWIASFGGLQGVWVMDILILYVSLLLIFRLECVFLDHKEALITTLFLAFFVQLPFCDGGGPEWIAMPGTIYTCYLLAKHLRNNIYSSFTEILLLSAAVGVCIMTKPNTAACIIPIALYIAVHLMTHWNWSIFVHYAGGVIVGLGIIIIPVALWIHSQGNWEDMVDCYWRFNAHQYAPHNAAEKWRGIRDITLVCLVGYYLYFIYAYINDKRHWQFWFITITFFFTVILNAYLRNGYPHYIFPCIGIFALMLAMTWKYITCHPWLKWFTTILFIAFFIIVFGIRSSFRLTPFDHQEDSEVAAYINSHPKSEYVMVYGHETRLIWDIKDPRFSFVYRLWLLLDGKPASKYFYIPPSMSDSMHKDIWTCIKERKPYWIVCYEGYETLFIELGYERDKTIGNDFLIMQGL